jgi:nucleoside-triphosphatase THEP1
MIVILTGTVGSGKTSFLRRLLSYLGSEGIAVAGFIGQRVFVEDELVGYDLIDVAVMRRHTFLRKGEGPADEAGRGRHPARQPAFGPVGGG